MIYRALILLLVAAAAQAITQQINYQGQLTTSGGAPLDTTVNMTFTIYDSAVDGTALWSELHLGVQVNDGLFNVRLGSVTLLPDVFNAPRWLGIQVGGDTEMTPREVLAAAPYAFRVSTVDEALGGHIYTNVAIGNGTTATGVSAFAAGETNSASGPFTNIGGGRSNQATVSGATVGGGVNNHAVGLYSTVSGGGGPALVDSNFAGSQGSTVGGGTSNSASAFFSTVAGGCGNTATDQFATVAGGLTNEATSDHATVGGGFNNNAFGDKSTVSGGTENTAQGAFTVISGGRDNIASGINATVGGGQRNYARGIYSTIGGGGGAAAVDSNHAGSQGSTVGGGTSNSASAFFATIAGGCGNQSTNQFATIGGGLTNEATNLHSTVAGGFNNNATGDKSSVGGGSENTASGLHATIPGGSGNLASNDYAFAAGRNALAASAGTFVWGASSSGASTAAFNPYTVTFRCQNGARFYTDSSNTVTGVSLEQGAGAWSSLCDVNQKRLHGAVNTRTILDKVSALPLHRWSYKSQDESVQHIGPTAQDFSAAFGLGGNNTTINTLDPDGVALAAIQELAKQNSEKDTKIADLEVRVKQLEAAILQYGSLIKSDKQ